MSLEAAPFTSLADELVARIAEWAEASEDAPLPADLERDLRDTQAPCNHTEHFVAKLC